MKHLRHYILFAAMCLITQFLLGETTDPQLVVGEIPEYPEIARIKNIEGTVIVEALVDEEGRVFAADVVQSVCKDLDKAALEAVSQWTFDPAKKDGKPIMKVVQIPVKFNLLDPTEESFMQSRNSALAKN
ncbi:MAG: energy transducer TonB [Puniceicoccaceae bacterium]